MEKNAKVCKWVRTCMFFLFRNVHYERNCVKSCTLECAVAKKGNGVEHLFFLFGCYRLILLSRKRVVVFFVLIIDIR